MTYDKQDLTIEIDSIKRKIRSAAIWVGVDLFLSGYCIYYSLEHFSRGQTDMGGLYTALTLLFGYGTYKKFGLVKTERQAFKEKKASLEKILDDENLIE